MSDQSSTLSLHGDCITLAQAVKTVGLANTGGQAKILVREGGFLVNGEPENRPGRKLRAGDRFATSEGRAWTVIA
jgi:ribosome-associated protein